MCITSIQCWTDVEDVGSMLYKCYTNVLCLLGICLPAPMAHSIRLCSKLLNGLECPVLSMIIVQYKMRVYIYSSDFGLPSVAIAQRKAIFSDSLTLIFLCHCYLNSNRHAAMKVKHVCHYLPDPEK